MLVLVGVEPELVLVETEVDFVDFEVASVVDDFVGVTVVFDDNDDDDDDEALVEVEGEVDVSDPGRHWPGSF